MKSKLYSADYSNVLTFIICPLGLVWMRNPLSYRQREAKRSTVFSSVSRQPDDPVQEQHWGYPLVGKHGRPKSFPVDGCFVIPRTLIQVK